MKKIPLTQRRFALVDDEDYEWLNRHNWYATKDRKSFIATRARKSEDDPGTYLILMHREIMRTPKGMEVDHRNHNRLDNQKQNLRNCTHSQNNHNTRALGGSSPFKGVSWYGASGKWHAQICYAGYHIHLGYHNIEEDAARAYDKTALELFNEFAYLNFPKKEIQNENLTTVPVHGTCQ